MANAPRRIAAPPLPADLDNLVRSTFGANYPMARAIMLAESGGNCSAISPTGDYGCFQVNLRWHPQYTAAQLLDYRVNVPAAYSISGGGTNWNAWSTYKNGRYLQYL